MKIDAIDLFYLSMPVVTTAGDGSQDALLVRARAGRFTGWGECEASPLTSIAAFICPMSHGACQPVSNSVLSQPLNDVADITRIAQHVREKSTDLLQAAHIFSGIEAALWDLLGQRLQAPVWSLLGYTTNYAKRPYASVLFKDTADDTFATAAALRQQGFTAVKFGWGNFGRGSLGQDEQQVEAARSGLGSDSLLMVDAGQAFGTDIDSATRLPMLAAHNVYWLEEPFISDAYEAYRQLAHKNVGISLAGGEASHTCNQAVHLMNLGGVKFIQVDCGRIGGVAPAFEVAQQANSRGITFVNHTFTSHLALSTSLQPYAGLADHGLCEYPTSLQPLALAITDNHLLPDCNGEIHLPDTPGLGMKVALEKLREYLLNIEISVSGKILYTTPVLSS
jgi:L-alanine-DL-glutamate epimerase-like enolase superfamily enzyme